MFWNSIQNTKYKAIEQIHQRLTVCKALKQPIACNNAEDEEFKFNRSVGSSRMLGSNLLPKIALQYSSIFQLTSLLTKCFSPFKHSCVRLNVFSSPSSKTRN